MELLFYAAGVSGGRTAPNPPKRHAPQNASALCPSVFQADLVSVLNILQYAEVSIAMTGNDAIPVRSW
jgi:hypothetical protein